MEIELVVERAGKARKRARFPFPHLIQRRDRFFGLRAKGVPALIQSGRHVSGHGRKLALRANHAPVPGHREDVVQRTLHPTGARMLRQSHFEPTGDAGLNDWLFIIISIHVDVVNRAMYM